jgi:glycosyltransferase involved in cell wall biosynthesis
VTVDVVIPCYNAAAHLRTTLDSVLAQTTRPHEIIVVDDGSTDASADIASAFAPPVRVVRQANAGECAARNRGFVESRSEWVAFLDADDVWEPAKLARQLECAERVSQVDCVHTDVYVFGAGAEQHGRQLQHADADRYTVETLLLEPVIHPSAAMVRRTVNERFPVGVRQGGDMLFFAGLALAGARFGCVNQPLVGYRLHAAQITREPDAWVTHFRNRFQWLHDVRSRLGPERSAALEERLRQQVVHWLNLARWNRQWDRYHTLKHYAQSLDWGGEPPPTVNERLLPRACYALKDWFDATVLRHAGSPGG